MDEAAAKGRRAGLWRASRRALLEVGGLLLTACALIALALALLPRLDLGGLVAAQASAALGRMVAIESLRVTPGRWLRLEMAGLRIGNIAGGTRPAMVELRHASLEVETLSLLRGPPVLRGVTVEGFTLLLERRHDRTANWHFGPARPAPSGPEDRSGFPTLLDAALRESEILVRTSSGQVLRTHLAHATIRTEGDQAPVLLHATGAYNAVPVTLEGRLEPIAALRDAARPYGTRLHMASGHTRLEFDGHMGDPFNVDRAQGRAVLHAPTLDTLLALAGAEAELDASLSLEGRLERHGDVWRLVAAEGHVAGESARVHLAEFTEGRTGHPDAVVLDLALGRLDLNRRLAAGSRAGAAEADLPLRVSMAPDPLLTAKVTLAELAYAGLVAREVEFVGALTPGRIAVESFALTTSGARLRASGQVDARQRGAAITGEVRLAEGDLGVMRQAFGLRSLPIDGRLDGWVAVAATGETLNGAARGARVSAVVAMQGGRIAREVIEMGSTDIRLLFRRARGTTPVSCLLGMLEMRAGIGEVAPLRIRSATGTIAGTASFDLNRKQLDLVIGSVRSTTSFWALDIPVRVWGSFGDPRIRPARWSAAGRARLAAADAIAPLPARLRDFAQRNPCYQGQAARSRPR